MDITPQNFNTALAAVLDDFKGKFSLKIEQKPALEQFIQKKYVFALLPIVVSLYSIVGLIG